VTELFVVAHLGHRCERRVFHGGELLLELGPRRRRRRGREQMQAVRPDQLLRDVVRPADLVVRRPVERPDLRLDRFLTRVALERAGFTGHALLRSRGLYPRLSERRREVSGAGRPKNPWSSSGSSARCAYSVDRLISSSAARSLIETSPTSRRTI